MDLADDLRLTEDEYLATAFISPIIVEREVAFLDGSAHGAVIDDDALAKKIEELAHIYCSFIWEETLN